MNSTNCVSQYSSFLELPLQSMSYEFSTFIYVEKFRNASNLLFRSCIRTSVFVKLIPRNPQKEKVESFRNRGSLTKQGIGKGILSDPFSKIQPNQNEDPSTRFQYPLALISILIILATLYIERKVIHVLIEREDPTIGKSFILKLSLYSFVLILKMTLVDIIFNYGGEWIKKPNVMYSKKLIHTWTGYDPNLLSFIDIVNEYNNKFGYLGVQQLIVTVPFGNCYEIDGDNGIRQLLYLGAIWLLVKVMQVLVMQRLQCMNY
ncbi:hypothetical protein H5410_004921 [Solanum commersonii]|uniref:Uncharacterized protein n=1 Tax=Solanum commersonii TaxID=4109 RepID=A0A9J6A6M3_SOLCO|nr:hypothetical protein H5410_004921 [Solanum commersonii]